MRLRNFLYVIVLIAVLSPDTIAGTASVYFGRNSGSGCTGSGVCQLSANGQGVTVNFSFVPNDGNGNNVLTMTFNLEAAQASGFVINTGTSYTFTAGYTFSDASLARQAGVPTGYSIPDGTVAQYTAPNPASNGNCALVITQVSPK